MIELNFWDIGSRGGVPSSWLTTELPIIVNAFDAPGSQYYNYESQFKKITVERHELILSEDSSPLLFYEQKGWGSGSTLFPPNQSNFWSKYIDGNYHDFSEKLIDTIALRDLNIPIPELIKIDIQGAELMVLRGMSSNQWANCLAIEIEISFVSNNKHVPLFGEVDSYLRSQGFIINGMRTSHEHATDLLGNKISNNIQLDEDSEYLVQVTQADCLYIKDFTKICDFNFEIYNQYMNILYIYKSLDKMIQLKDFANTKGIDIDNLIYNDYINKFSEIMKCKNTEGIHAKIPSGL